MKSVWVDGVGCCLFADEEDQVEFAVSGKVKSVFVWVCN